ncbi:glycosyltransferase family 2 protein [Salegentibacter sp. Hel_I_6]|uniref:glycosyltransferase family 2 protein n=1 Tax=Salegentibacter sp. Hel_I_6 TaxID=1250278 RepID=UPI00068BE019|nr:glycosyltransferase [Salegentibacter sp. Hel_I_6]
MKNLKFSVIIPTCHRNELLAECLEKLSKQDYSLDQIEIIVTDDGKVSTAKPMLDSYFPFVKWTKGAGSGPAANRNNGARIAKGQWLIFTDDDCQPDPCWIEEYEKAVESNPGTKVFEGRTYPDKSKMAFNEVAPINETGGHMPSCNFMISRELYWDLGGFDENFKFYFEDMDFSYRIKSLGFSTLFLPKAAVCHPWRKVDAISFWKNRKFYKESYWKFIIKDEELFRSHNSLFFLKQFTKDLVFDTFKNLFRYRAKGLIYNLSHRMIHLELFFRTLLNSTPYKDLKKGLLLE